MPDQRYRNFDLHLARDGAGWRVSCPDPAGATVGVAFGLAPGGADLAARLERLRGRGQGGGNAVGSGPAVAAQADAEEAAREFGRALYEAALYGAVGEAFRRETAAARDAGVGLRLRLHLREAPELAGLPWEFLQDPVREQFLALLRLSPVVRDLDLEDPVPADRFEPPLRVLVVISAPTGYESLAVNKEWRLLRESLAPLENRGRLRLEKLEDGRLRTLQRQMRDRDYHVLHFIGHGSFESDRGEGVLVFEDDEGGGHLVSGDELGNLLSDEPTLRLVVLNACEGARAPSDDPFSGVAQHVLRGGVRAVIAMQAAISDAAAAVLSEELYSAIAAGLPADIALTEARKRVYNEISKVEWATPVLYARGTGPTALEVISAAPGSAEQGVPAGAPVAGADFEPRPFPEIPAATATGSRTDPARRRLRALATAVLASGLILALPFGLRFFRQQRNLNRDARLLEAFGGVLFRAAEAGPDLRLADPPESGIPAAAVQARAAGVPPLSPGQTAQWARLHLVVAEARTLLALRTNAPDTVVGWLEEPIEFRGRWVRQVLLANGKVVARVLATPTASPFAVGSGKGTP